MEGKEKRISLSTPKNMSSKRCSLSKSRKSTKSDLDNFLNASFTNKAKNKNRYYLSTSAQFNPQSSPTSPFDKHFPIHPNHVFPHRSRIKTTNPNSNPKLKKKPTKSNPNHNPNPISNPMTNPRTVPKKSQIEQILKQDVKLRVYESVQFNQWMQLLRQYKSNVPNKENETNIVLRELEKILELKEELEIRKYRLISSMI